MIFLIKLSSVSYFLTQLHGVTGKYELASIIWYQIIYDNARLVLKHPNTGNHNCLFFFVTSTYFYYWDHLNWDGSGGGGGAQICPCQFAS